jgi:hypothetical protein
MDATRFDSLAKSVSAAGTRRGLVRLLTATPLAILLAPLLGAEDGAAKRRKDRGKVKAEKKNKHRDKVGSDNHKHSGRRRKHRNKRSNGHHDKKCKPQSTAQTCDGKCGKVPNNCKKTVDCGSCACAPACSICRTCNPETTRCDPDPAQLGEPCGDGLVCQDDGRCACQGRSCGGCRACEGGACVPDPSVVCEPADQCHEAGACDPATGQCTTPRKADGTSCDDGDPCTLDDACQQGACRGTPKDCSSEEDVCNDGVCRSSDGECVKRPKPDGTGCNADHTDCTTGDSCQHGVCTPGAGIDCRGEDDQCNRGVCRTSDGRCIKEPRPGIACDHPDRCMDGGTCQQNGTCGGGTARICTARDECHDAGVCNPANGDCSHPAKADGAPCSTGECIGGVCMSVCLGLQTPCVSGTQCCQTSFTSCNRAAENCYATGAPRNTQCCHAPHGACSESCDCCGNSLCERGACCRFPGGACNSPDDCCSEFSTQTCNAAGTCCVLEGFPCEEDGNCCTGTCTENGCQGCLQLQQSCEEDSQCCETSGEVTVCDERRFGEIMCCRMAGGACTADDDCCRDGTCCNGTCCPFGSECNSGVCQDICSEHHENCSTSQLCCDGLQCRQATWPDRRSICRDATCSETLEGCDPAGGGARPCCEGTCTPDGLGGGQCCSPEGRECHDLGRFFPGGDCCGPLVCNGRNQCARCRTAGETCDGDEVSSNCCNTAFADHPLVCHQGHCAVCPESGEPCVDFGDGPTCCNGLLSPCTANGICR